MHEILKAIHRCTLPRKRTCSPALKLFYLEVWGQNACFEKFLMCVLRFEGALKDIENKEGKCAFELCEDQLVKDMILKFGEEEEDNDDNDPNSRKRRSCWNCGKTAINRCTGCKVANYCSIECQKKNWKEHKDECARLKKANKDAKRIFQISNLDGEAKEILEKANIPKDMLEDEKNLFIVLNILHFQTGKVYSTRNWKNGKKQITIPTAVQEEVVLSFFSVEKEVALVTEGDPKLLYEVDKESRKRNVFKALHKGTSEHVAVKILQFKDSKGKSLALREIGIVKNNSHRNLMKFIDCYKISNKFWLITEYIEGGSIKEALNVRGFQENEIVYILRETLRGLEVLHERKIVHRDLKPSNIMLDRNGMVKIIDFGLCAENFDGYLSRMVGSPFYVPPEMIIRFPYDWSADIWSLGVTLLTIVEDGKTPYPDPLLSMFMYATTQLVCTNEKISKGLRQILTQMVYIVPMERPSCSELLSVLNFDVFNANETLASIWGTKPEEIKKEVDDTNVDQLLDEDYPKFLEEALPKDFDDLD